MSIFFIKICFEYPVILQSAQMPEPLCRASQLFYRLQFLPEYALSFYQSRYYISVNTYFSMGGIDSVIIRSVHKSLQSIQITVKTQMDSKHIDLFVYRS